MASDRHDEGVHPERRGDRGDDGARGDALPPTMDVREEDLEPHEGLRYIARLFKLLAVLLVLLLVGEVVVALMRQGTAAIPNLLIDGTRLVVWAGLMWGAGDLALMLIESNHDLRATRILVGRLNARMQRVEDRMFGGGGGASGGAPRPGRPPEGPRPPSHQELQ